MVEEVDEGRDTDAGVAGPHAHRQLVAEVARGRLPHPGDPQVLPQQGSGLDVEVVERDDAIDRLGAGEKADAFDELVRWRPDPHEEDVVDGVARPVGSGEAVERQQQDAAALPAALTQEVVPLLIGRDAEHRQRAAVRHASSFQRWAQSAEGATRLRGAGRPTGSAGTPDDSPGGRPPSSAAGVRRGLRTPSAAPLLRGGARRFIVSIAN